MFTRRVVIACLTALGGAVSVVNRAMACAASPAQRLRSGRGHWAMETLWAYRFHAGGSAPRPMGNTKRVKLAATYRWMTVDFLTGDRRIKRVTPGWSGITDPDTREYLTRGLTALSHDPVGCAPAALAQYAEAHKVGGSGRSWTELFAVTTKSAVALRRIDSGGVAFWDREVFLLRAPT